MANVYDVDQTELVEKTAVELQQIEEMNPPEWAIFVKTGAHKERAPLKKDWWYYRSASVLRIVYRLGPIGVSKLRTKYGGKKNRGVKPGKFYRASGNVLRKVLQQLQKSGLVEESKDKKRKGRIISGKGKSLLDKTASKIANFGAKPKKVAPKKEEKPVEEKKEEKPTKKISIST